MYETYSKTFRISTADTDLYNACRPSAMLSYFQDLATEHATLIGVDRDYLVENYHACWLIARVWMHLERPLRAGEEVKMVTWQRGTGGLIVYRDYDLYVGGKWVGEGIAAWLVADVEDRKMLRPGSIEKLVTSPTPETVKDRQIRLIRSPKDRKVVYEKMIRYSDLDVNGHMNNAKYADVVLDALTPEELDGKFIAELQLNYSQECKMGEVIAIARGEKEGRCYIDGSSDDGKRRFEASVQILPLP